MKVDYLINQLSKTSIPITWANYINKHISGINVRITSIREVKSLKNVFYSDIIHGHHVKAMYIILLINKILNKKTIYTVHGSYLYLSQDNKKMFEYICEKSDKIIFVNRFLYDVLPDKIKKNINNKYEIILNGINLNLKYEKINVYKKFSIPNDCKIIFHPARFVKEKNHINVIRAFKKVRDNLKDVKLVLAGDGNLKSKIMNEIKHLNLENDIILLGMIKRHEVYNFLEKVDLFIMPSLSEGLNIAFLEAMVFKRKILVSSIPQFTYPFEHYNLLPSDYNVYFTDPNNIEEISNKMIETLHLPKKNIFDMSYFSIENMINKYLTVYKEFI